MKQMMGSVAAGAFGLALMCGVVGLMSSSSAAASQPAEVAVPSESTIELASMANAFDPDQPSRVPTDKRKFYFPIRPQPRGFLVGK